MTTTKKTKLDLVNYFTNYISDCGYNNYYGYKMSDEDFKKLMMKKQTWEIKNILNDFSNETQSFLNS